MAKFATSNVAGVDLTQSFTPVSSTGSLYGTSGTYSPPFKVGQMIIASDGSQWLYVLFGTGGVTGVGYVVVIDVAFGAVMMSNSVGTLGAKIGVVPYAAAAGDYGFVQVYGECDAIQTATALANTALASTTTAGRLDDANGTGTKNLSGIFITTAQAGASGNSPGVLNWPVVGSTN